MIKKLQELASRFILSNTGYVVIPADRYAAMALEISKVNEALQDERQKPIRIATPEYLLMSQLHSFVPNFEFLASKDDQFKTRLGRICYEAMQSEEFKYLTEYLKQDQVNKYLFEADHKSEDWMRGTINGLYIFEEEVRLLAAGYDDRLGKGLIQTKPKKS